MTEVGHADLSRLLHSKRNEFTTIVTSRKRKLRELFAVATHSSSLPTLAFVNPDASPPTPAEIHFLQANDILKGKLLAENDLPQRTKPSLEALRRSLAPTFDVSPESKHLPPQEHGLKAPQPAPPPSELASQPRPVAEAPPDAGRAGPTPISPPQAISTPIAVQAFSPSPPPGPEHASPAPLPQPSSSSVAGKPQQEPRPDEHAEKRSFQVSFLPGTKGSSSAEPAAANENCLSRLGEPAHSKLAHHSKAPDALSSPGSTAYSATTAAAVDESTDTSPEDEELPDADLTKDKPQQADGGVGEAGQDKARDTDANLDNGLAEEQLLQESIRSSVAPKTEQSPTVSAPDRTRANAHTSDAPETPRDEPHQPETVTAVEHVTEVPDSEQNVPDQMEVDVFPEPASKPAGGALKAAAAAPPPLTGQSAPGGVEPATVGGEKPSAGDGSVAPERAVTRVSSGAMRLKSVSEIVGATPRNTQNKDSPTQLTPVTSTPHSPTPRIKTGALHKRDRSRGQTTVLFGKQPKRVENETVMSGHKEVLQPLDDYFTPLFLQNFANSSSWMQPLEKILFHANKTLATPDTNLAIQEHQACRVLKKVYNLQQSEKWSLRQHKRCTEPIRPPSLWDVLLREARWMRTDFREERKWKTAVARNLAHACALWHECSPDERKLLQVPATRVPKNRASSDVPMNDAVGDGKVEDQLTPDLVSSGDVESPQAVDELADDFAETVPPSAIFTLQEDDVVFGLRRSPTSDQLLKELPMFGSPLELPKMGLMGPQYDPDAHWRRPALPLNKYVEGPMKLKDAAFPRKRSRFDYGNEDSDEEHDTKVFDDHAVHRVKLPPMTDEVALFNPESKPIRDRLHAGHQFRPPSEHPMPSQSFYECRSPSQWTVAEDDELRSLVREYSYNWSLISSMLTTRSLFTAGAERRTPWECFERWINLEGLPSDMQRTQYFKSYNSRIETAQRVISQQNQIAAQQATASGSTVAPRRRQSVPLRVERRRNQKHLTLIDTMRKLAKKRETSIQKQQHTASQNVTNKRSNDAIVQKPTKTPRDYSLLRWERDQALAEKMAQYAQRQEAQRRAAMQARLQQAQGVQMASATAGSAQVGQNSVPGVQNGMNAPGRGALSNQLAAAAAAAAVAGQTRPRVQLQAPVNGVVAQAAAQTQVNGGLVPPQMNGVQQAQMQQAMQGLQGHQMMQMTSQQPDASLMMRAQRISEQQRAAVQIQQAQQQQQQHLPPQHHPQQPHPQPPAQHQRAGSGTPGPSSQQGSPPNMRNGMNNLGHQTFMNSAQAMMAQISAANNGHVAANASAYHVSGVPNGSPGHRPVPQIPASIAAQLSQLETQLKAKNPNLTPEQARHLATEHLTRAMMAQRQNAMNAAAGATNQPGIASSIAATTSPHQYAALLRQQQQQQQQQQRVAVASSSPVSAHQRQSSGSATPSTGK